MGFTQGSMPGKITQRPQYHEEYLHGGYYTRYVGWLNSYEREKMLHGFFGLVVAVCFIMYRIVDQCQSLQLYC
jgi:hypothetical protein